MPMSIRKHHRVADPTASGSLRLPVGTVPFCLTINYSEPSQSQGDLYLDSLC